MAMIELAAFPLRERSNIHYQIEFNLGQRPPSKRVEVKNLTDVRRELASFGVEMETTGKPWMISPRAIGRAVSGFNKEYKTLQVFVNEKMVWVDKA